MITADIAAWGDWISNAPQPFQRATMRAAMLVMDSQFRVNPESAQDNRYVVLDDDADARIAWRQHQELARVTHSVGIPVLSLNGVPESPDAVFCNNAFGTIPRRLVVGSMHYPSRQHETARMDVRELFCDAFGYELVDLSQRKLTAELTGALVIDRARMIGFCGLSERCDEAGARAMAEAFNLDGMFIFDLAPGEYHTNVVLAVLAGRVCVVAPGGIAETEAVDAIGALYGDNVLRLNPEAAAAFAGNCIALTPDDVVMSQTAYDALTDEEKQFFADRQFTLHPVQVDEFEKAGGSVRCLIGEIF